MKLKILSILILLFSMGCTHLSSLSTSSVPKERNVKVSAVQERFIFFLFNFNNDYVNNMAEDLANQCPKGKVQGILTKHENITYFPIIAHKIRVTAEGYCLKANNG